MAVKIKNMVLICVTAAFLLGFFLWSVIKPPEAVSLSERRPLAEFPELTGESILSGEFMSAFESYTLDQFPLRDTFRGVKAVTARYLLGQRDNNGIYMENGYLSKLDYPLNEASVDYALGRFRFVYEQYLAGKDMEVYCSVIPDKNYFMAEENGYPSMDYEGLFDRVREGADFARYIDIAPLLKLSDYYRTDTHWRQEQILDVAGRLASAMGVTLTGDYREEKLPEPFYGVYYGQAALPVPGEKLYYLTNDLLSACQVYDYETDAYLPVYDLEKAEGQDPYEVFLSGPKSIQVLENPQADTERELILFRDSFGSSLAPLLMEGYARITLVDIRYVSPASLGQFVTFEDQDVLFLYSASVLNDSVTIK